MENSEQCKTDHPTTTNQNYVSCIKIHGLEILPPILTDEKRKCMQYYRDLAIQVEEKIKNRKCKRIHDDTTESEHSATCNDSEVSSISDSVVYSSDKSSNEEPTFRSVTFTESCRSDVLHMLNDSQNKKSEFENDIHATVEMPLLDKSAIKNVPLNSIDVSDVESDKKKCFEIDPIIKNSETLVTQDSLNSNLINVDLDEQLPNCKTIIPTKNECNTNNINDTSIIIKDSESISEDVTITNESPGEKTPLIRRNSYIIENPSPYLLALINQNNTDSSSDKDKQSPTSNSTSNSNSNSNSGQHKRRRWNLEKAREKWSSIEQDLNHAVQKHTLKRNDINFNSLPTSAVTSPDTKMFDSSLITLPNITSKTQLPEKESDIPTNDKPKHLNNIKSVQNITNGTDKSDSRFIRSYVTPLRKPNQPKRIDSKFASPTKTQLDKKEKVHQNTLQTKKTDLGKNTLIRQRRLSFDELKRTNPSKINNNSVVHKSNSSLSRSPEKNIKSIRTTPNKSIKPQNVQSKYIPEHQIHELISKISLEQSNQMAMLLEKQRSEQEQLMKLFAEQQALLISKLRCTYQNPIENQTESVIETKNKLEIETALDSAVVTADLKKSEKTLNECRKMLDFDTSYADSSSNQSQSSPEDSLKISPPLSNISNVSNQMENKIISSSRHYSFHLDFNRNSKQSDLQIIDLELSNRFLSESFCPATASSSRYTCSTDSLDMNTTVKPLEKKRSLNRLATTCSRQLFPTEKQIWAATKLCAATRGFLVRRLIKTERVQNLVKTIRDSLLCAMELHHEKADNIQPADVELHRRLIQQVTAACYAFHDTFFDLSTSEQMSIIAFDRERQKEKLLRPASSRSNTSLSSTTQKVLERKLKRRSSDSASANQSRCSSSRSTYNSGDYRPRTKSLGMQDPPENNNPKKISPSNDVITHRAMSYGANKKPWR